MSIEECKSVKCPCQNGGICEGDVTNKTGTLRCNCSQSKFEGKLCDNFIDFCDSKQPCQNGGTCQTLFGSFKCICPKRYNGTTCENKISFLSKSDQHEGKCAARGHS